MGSLMDKTSYFIAEGFPTHRAFVRLLSSVESLVDNKRLFPSEAFAADRALVGFLSSVCPLVDNQVRSTIRDLPAILALIRLFFRRPFLVFRKMIGGWIEASFRIRAWFFSWATIVSVLQAACCRKEILLLIAVS